MITLFDIPSNVPGQAWSSNTLKIRLALNFKNLPFKTEWVEYPDIATALKKHNIGPTKTYPDGSPYYSLPAIVDVDDGTGEVKAALAESLDIAKYLDQAYPNTPRLVPENPDEAFQNLVDRLPQRMMPIALILFKATIPKLNSASQAHFNQARAKDLYQTYHTTTIEEIHFSQEEKAAAWIEVKRAFNNVYLQLGEEGEKGLWYLGDEISFVDVVIGAFLLAIKKILGEDSGEWTDVKGWNEGRWTRIAEGMEPYDK